MTYRIMIVDDEKPSRTLLKHVIDWTEFQLVFAGEAASGIEAINIVDELEPDIIFADIRMPFMDGIEFSKIVIKRYPKIKVIILTTYPDFSYAQQCIGIGVADYVLKPIMRSEINEALRKVIKQLRQEELEEPCNEIIDDSTLQKKRIEKYIRENYRDSQLNLTVLADYFGFNSSYFSRKFKEAFTISFKEYLLEVRMVKAIEYAKRGKLMYRTAELVGIPDSNYFSRCFKKYTGEKYSEFQKNLINDVKEQKYDNN